MTSTFIQLGRPLQSDHVCHTCSTSISPSLAPGHAAPSLEASSASRTCHVAISVTELRRPNTTVKSRMAVPSLLLAAAAVVAPHASPRPTRLVDSRVRALSHIHASAGAPPEPAPPAETKKPVQLSPQNAMAEFGPLLEQVKLVWTEGSTWTVEEREQRRRDILEKYVQVFAPALAFSAAQLGLTISLFITVLLALNISGRGFNDLSDALSGLPLLGNLLDKVDPSWGNAAIALVIVEVSAPILIPIAVAVTPGIATSLNTQLEAWGLDAEGLNERIKKVLKDTSK